MTVNFKEWSHSEERNKNGYGIELLQITDDAKAIEQLTAVVPSHFASQYENILVRLGKPKAAAYLTEKLPTFKNIKSGDLGEIIATEYINNHTDFETPIKRLRWKDHRNQSMRGDDAIAVFFPENNGADIVFLKLEAKSAQAMSQGTVNRAREALDGYEGRPSPHSLTFVADRLYEMNEAEKADQIIIFQTKVDIKDDQVEHMLFTYSANNPKAYLEVDQSSCASNFYQNTVGVHTKSHSSIIETVFNLAGGNDAA